VNPRNDTRNDQNGATTLDTPCFAIGFADRCWHGVPPWQRWRGKCLIASSPRNGYFDRVLVWRQTSTAMNKLFQERGRVILRGVNHGASGCIPSPRSYCWAGRIEDGIGPSWISNAKTERVTSRLLPRRFRFDASDEFLVVDEGMKEVAPCVGGTTSIGKHLP